MEFNGKGEPASNYYRVSHEIAENPKFLRLSVGAQSLYHTFCRLRNRYGNEQGIFYRSNSGLANDMGVTIVSVIRMRKELLKNGFLRWQQGNNGQACQYQIDHIHE